jgi:hypothetical protein
MNQEPHVPAEVTDTSAPAKPPEVMKTKVEETSAPTEIIERLAPRPHWVTIALGFLSPALALVSLYFSLNSLHIAQKGLETAQQTMTNAQRTVEVNE